MAITIETIVEGLRGLGLGRGDVVIVHSNLRLLGKARELVKLSNCGADLVIDGLIEVVGGEGLVVFPTLTSTFDEGEPGPRGEG